MSVSQPTAVAGVAAEDFMIPSDTPGIELFVRNKRLEGMAAFSPERSVLFVHGSSYPSETAFDLPLAGVSWMDHIAAAGFDASDSQSRQDLPTSLQNCLFIAQ